METCEVIHNPWAGHPWTTIPEAEREAAAAATARNREIQRVFARLRVEADCARISAEVTRAAQARAQE